MNEARINTIYFCGYGPKCEKTQYGSTTSFDVDREMNAMLAALELLRAVNRGVNITQEALWQAVMRHNMPGVEQATTSGMPHVPSVSEKAAMLDWLIAQCGSIDNLTGTQVKLSQDNISSDCLVSVGYSERQPRLKFIGDTFYDAIREGMKGTPK